MHHQHNIKWRNSCPCKCEKSTFAGVETWSSGRRSQSVSDIRHQLVQNLTCHIHTSLRVAVGQTSGTPSTGFTASQKVFHHTIRIAVAIAHIVLLCPSCCISLSETFQKVGSGTSTLFWAGKSGAATSTSTIRPARAHLLADGWRCKAASGDDGRDANAKASFWRGSADGDKGCGLEAARPSEKERTCRDRVLDNLQCSQAKTQICVLFYSAMESPL